MKLRTKTKKILSGGLALGILCSGATLITPENKVYAADASTKALIFKSTFGKIYDKFLKEPFVQWADSYDVQNGYHQYQENVTYKAPDFEPGQFTINVFSYFKNQDFSKRVKLLKPDGTTEIHTLHHGEQLIIKQPGTLVRLNVDPSNYHTDKFADATKGHYIYVSQNMINQGNLGISIGNWKTYFLEKANTPKINSTLIEKFYPNENPGNFSYDKEALYNRLDPERKAIATITSNTLTNQDFFDKSKKAVPLGYPELDKNRYEISDEQLREKIEALEGVPVEGIHRY